MSGTWKPRRLPDCPLAAGLVWHRGTYGKRQFGDPYAQWAYVCPSYPEGLEITHVRDEPLAIQTEVAWTWFTANFDPFDPAAPWFGFAEAGDVGSAPFAPDRRAANLILLEEFHGIVAPTVLAETAKVFTDQAALWIMKLPPSPVSGTPEAAMVRATLKRLKEATEAPPPSGHNQGPPLTDLVLAAEVADGVRQVEGALAASEVEGKRSPIVAAAVKAGQDTLAGVMRQVGQELARLGLPEAGHWLSNLYRLLVDGLTVLLQWWSGT